MSNVRGSSRRLAIPLVGLLAAIAVAAGQEPPVAGQEPPLEARARRGTIQSELDYLQAAKLPITIELTQVTIKQAYDGIARQAGLTIAYEGSVNDVSKHDVSFKTTTLKEVLDELGAKFKLVYRTDGPDKLTVIGAIPK